MGERSHRYNGGMDAWEFLERRSEAEPRPVYVIHGDDDFLRRRVRAALRQLVLGEEEDQVSYSTHAGEAADFASIRDQLATLPFLSPRRLVVVEEADPFVSRFRSQLEKYLHAPAPRGVLVLEVKSWSSTTRLARLVPPEATLVCKGLSPAQLPAWCIQWAKKEHGKLLSRPAAELLVELVGPDMGLLDQELRKLAIYVGDTARIDVDDVDQLVGRSRSAEAFKILDALVSNRPGEAWQILNRLFEQGEDEHRLLGLFSYQLRRLAQAAQLVEQGLPASAALVQVGVPPFAIKGCEQQLRHLGRQRACQLYDWLLEIDLGIKGASALPPRLLFERLLVRLAGR
ncbi:MAG: DNA polymerase III subunit delta [Gemmataceae bacterium]|nr:DNA polymerase III subunit delta [Gemmataceae bacterium]MDW8264657.1 DNA polymerase III subunit delta [Gemmataceae bacterium]